MSYQRALLMLGRMKKKGWVEWGIDGLGQRAWVITSEGFTACYHEIERRVKFKISKKTTLSSYMLKVVDMAIEAFAELKKAGWRDVQAREALINYDIGKITWAIRITKYRVADNPGAYIHSLIKNGHDHRKRCQVYIERSTGCYITPYIKEEVVHEALKTTRPLDTTKILSREVRRDTTRKDLDEICTKLWRDGDIELKEWKQLKRRAPYIKALLS